MNPNMPIPYMARTRAYYLALGYDNPYSWAHYDSVPFQRLVKPLWECRIALVTTAAPYQPDKGEQGAGAPYNASAKFYQIYSGDSAKDHDLRISHVGVDRIHTRHSDSGTWFPLPLLQQLAADGLFVLGPRFHGLPTNRSQRHTLEVDCPELLSRCRADAVDAAILVANCPVCHQTLSLAARHLEANGIATVVLGCALDVVEHCGVPRFVFSDYPLGNAAGRPYDVDSQKFTLRLALDLLASATAPRTTVRSPLSWSTDSAWKLDYANAERLSQVEIARLRAEFEAGRQVGKEIRACTLGEACANVAKS